MTIDRYRLIGVLELLLVIVFFALGQLPIPLAIILLLGAIADIV